MSDNIIQLNEAAIKGELKELVKNSVEETLNALLDHEADELVKADVYSAQSARLSRLISPPFSDFLPSCHGVEPSDFD